MPFTHGVLSFSGDRRTELWACQDSPSNCPYRLGQGHEVAGRQCQCLAFETPEAVVELLLGTLAHAGDMSLLRGVLSKDAGVQRGMSDSQVIKRVAELVVSHRLCIVTEGGEQRTRSASSSAAPLRRAASVTPSRLVERAPSPAPTPTTPPATDTDLSVDVNQAVQAAALEQAAELGTPLCEVCEKAKQQAGSSSAT
jgi:hypothetical protein